MTIPIWLASDIDSTQEDTADEIDRLIEALKVSGISAIPDLTVDAFSFIVVDRIELDNKGGAFR